jgi:hypothetical protein
MCFNEHKPNITGLEFYHLGYNGVQAIKNQPNLEVHAASIYKVDEYAKQDAWFLA